MKKAKSTVSEHQGPAGIIPESTAGRMIHPQLVGPHPSMCLGLRYSRRMHHLNPTPPLTGWLAGLARFPPMSRRRTTFARVKRGARIDELLERNVARDRLTPVVDPKGTHELLLVHALVSKNALGDVGHVVAWRQKPWEHHLQCAPVQRMYARFSVHGAHIGGRRCLGLVETRQPRAIRRVVASAHCRRGRVYHGTRPGDPRVDARRGHGKPSEFVEPSPSWWRSASQFSRR